MNEQNYKITDIENPSGLSQRIAVLGIVCFIAVRTLYISLIQRDFAPTFLDEVLLVILLPSAISGMIAANSNKFLMIIIYSYIGYVLTCFFGFAIVGQNYGITFYSAIIGVILDLKFVVMLLGTYFLIKKGHFRGVHFVLFLWVIIVVSFVNSGFVVRDFFSVSDIYDKLLDKRSGLVLPNGLFGHKTPSSQVHFLGMVASMALYRSTLSKAALVGLFLNLVLVFMHQGSKESICAAVVILYFFLGSGHYKGIVRTGIYLVVFFLIMLMFVYHSGEYSAIDRVTMYLGDDGDMTARRRLLAAAGQIAVDNFPIGTGSASYGSEPSRRGVFSAVYEMYGLYGVGLSEQNSSYLMDGFWHKVIGEGGFFGSMLVMVSFLTITVMSVFKSKYVNSLILYRGAFLNISPFTIGVVLLVVLSSFASPVMTSEILLIPLCIAISVIVIGRAAAISGGHL